MGQQQILTMHLMVKVLIKNRLSLGLSIFLCVIGCSIPTDKKIIVAGFDNHAWKTDSLGCLGKRNKLALILVEKMDSFIRGRDKETLVDFLGQPNIRYFGISDSMYCYFVSGGRQCFDSLWEEKKAFEAEQILFFIDKRGKIKGTTGLIYP